jgi:high affinity choline transporter 7
MTLAQNTNLPSTPVKTAARLAPRMPEILFTLMLTATVIISAIKGTNIHWPGLILMLLSYVLVYFVGVAAAKGKGSSIEDMIVANRSLPLWIGVFSMAATWIDGGYINGTAEYAYSTGLVWAQAPWCYALSLMIGGVLFARTMRRHRFMTMLDPLEYRYGNRITAWLYLTSLLGDLFWSAAILTALGTTFGAILGMDVVTSILVSAAVAIIYTMAGGMWSVAFTSVIQVIIILLGLFLVLPFILPQAGGAVTAVKKYMSGMGGNASLFPPLTGWKDPAWGNQYWRWWDMALLLIFGGIPWQGYFQRVLSAKDEKAAMWLSILAGLVCLLVAVPSALIGIVGYSTNWASVGTLAPQNAAMILPYVLRFLTPPLVAGLGLGAVAAAVMSSVASSILSSSSMAAWNVYRPLLRPQAAGAELQKVVKWAIPVIGIAATLIALNVQSVYALWYLCADLIYCILFPQLTTALYFKRSNRYGAIAGLIVSFFLRVGGGEPLLGIAPIIPYPMTEHGVVYFPFRLLATASGFLAIIIVSILTQRACPAQQWESRD